jgi:hypothetical protein
MCLSKIQIESILFQYTIHSLNMVSTSRKSWFRPTFFLVWWWSNHLLIHIWLEDVIFVMLCNLGLPFWFFILFDISIGTLNSLDYCIDYFHKVNVNIAKHDVMCSFLNIFKFFLRNGIFIVFFTILICKCACDDIHVMVTCIPLDVTIR